MINFKWALAHSMANSKVNVLRAAAGNIAVPGQEVPVISGAARDRPYALTFKKLAGAACKKREGEVRTGKISERIPCDTAY